MKLRNQSCQLILGHYNAPSNLPFELSGIYFFQQVKHLSAYLQYLQTKAGALSDLLPV